MNDQFLNNTFHPIYIPSFFPLPPTYRKFLLARFQDNLNLLFLVHRKKCDITQNSIFQIALISCHSYVIHSTWCIDSSGTRYLFCVCGSQNTNSESMGLVFFDFLTIFFSFIHFPYSVLNSDTFLNVFSISSLDNTPIQFSLFQFHSIHIWFIHLFTCRRSVLVMKIYNRI